jgi:LysM repeat protein
VTTPAYCLPINATEPGTASTCDCFTQVHGYQNTSGKSWSCRSLSAGKMPPPLTSIVDYNCEDMASEFSITVSQLTIWNTWLGSDCDIALYANLGYEDTRAICIGVNASAPTGTASAPPSTIPTQTGTKPTASMGSTQTGVVAECQQFYTVQSGDSCYSIETTFGITFAQFYQWNPSGMSPIPPTLVLSWCCITSMMEKILLFACAYLTWRQWEAIARTCGWAMRIAWRDLLQPPPQSSPTATSPGLTSPAQSGIASNCDEYYTVVSGDLCSKIETQFDITFAQLYQWNPAIGSNCESL